MRRFLFSGSLLSALLAGVGLAQRTIQGPRDWRVLLLWASWVISVVLAVASVLERDGRRG